MKHKVKNWFQKVWKKIMPDKPMGRAEKVARYAFAIVLGGTLSLFILGFLTLAFFSIGLPNPADLRDLNLTESTLIMDREGNLLYAIHGEENRESLDSLEDVSPWLLEATVAIEDDQFYKHIGIDLPAIFRAALSEIGIGSPRGGSTITQQFVKSTYLSPERTYSRKIKEIMLALLVEFKFKKDEILLMYLNAIPYGNNAHGIQLASERYFGKDASELSLGESAILASIPQAPTRYSPYGNYRYSVLNVELTADYLGNREIVSEIDLEYEEYARGLIGQSFTLPDGDTFYIKGRSDLVLDRMEELGMIDENEKTLALEEIHAKEFTPYRETIAAPHFVLWVKQLLEEKYGSSVVEQGGLKVYTTLDPNYQKAAEEAIAEKKDWTLSNYGASNSALVSVQPQTGQILAMVGSADYFDDTIDGQVNMITSPRQPGSSFKPFVYALTFLNRYSPATILYDVRTRFGTDVPDNYEGGFMGPISIRTALGKSRNIPAAKAYFLAGQEEAIVPFVKKFGITTISEEGNYGWPLALGTAEVTPLEFAGAYSVFANMGTRVPLSPILKIENSQGEIMEEWNEKDLVEEEILDPQVAFLINDILSDPSVGLGPNVRVESIDNAAKTGTSNKVMPNGSILPNNAWIAAYTPTLVTVVWSGNANGEPMKGNGDGYNTSAPIWKTYINKIADKLTTPTIWERPEGIVDIAISKASGKLPSSSTPSDMIGSEVFASFAIPTEIDDAFRTAKIETISNRLATEYSPEEYVETRSYRVHKSIMAEQWPTWQQDVLAWALQQGEDQPPTEFATDIHNATTAANPPEITITSPNSLSAVSGRTVDIEVDILDEGNGLKEVLFLLGDQVHYHATSSPYEGTIRIPTNLGDGDTFEVTAKAVDVYGYSSTSTIEVRIDSDSSSSNDEEEDSGNNGNGNGNSNNESARVEDDFLDLDNIINL